MNQSRIREGLRALAEAERRRPSASVENALMAEWQRAHRARYWKAAVFAGALAAGVACVMFLLRPHSEEIRIVKKQPEIAMAARPVAVVPAAMSRPMRRRVRRRAQLQQQEAVAEFTDVPFAAPLDTGERAQLLRVSMPATTLASWGFSMGAGDPDRVINADVVVGENGLARAVRLVR